MLKQLQLAALVCAVATNALAQEPPPTDASPSEDTTTPVESTAPPEMGTPAPAPEASAVAMAAEPATAEPAPEPWYSKIKLEGMVDGFFSYQVGAALEGRNAMRVFDVPVGTFALGYAELAVGMAPEPAGFRLDFGFGTVADQVQGVLLPDIQTGATSSALSEAYKHIQQAYASVKLGDAVTLDVGKFVTSAGAEVIEAPLNWLYTRSILFGFAIPFTHTGARASFAAGDSLTIQAALLNGWDANLDLNRAKTLGFSALYNGSSGTFAALNIYAGPETLAPDWRFVADLVLSQTLGDAFALNLNVDYGFEGENRWYGASLMAKYTLSDAVYLAARAELFADPEGFRAGTEDTTYLAGTLGAGFPIGKNAELRLEGRYDNASNPVLGVTGDQSGQTTVTAAALAWF